MGTFAPCTLPALNAIPWLRHIVTMRNATLPLGGDMSFTTGAACPEGIVANRRHALAAINRTPDQAVMSGLVHHTDVRSVDWSDAGRGVTTPATAIPRTDGMMTNAPGLTLMMCFADCVPLIVVDTEQRVIGLAHAGWRGTLAGMTGRLITAMCQTYDCHPEAMLAVIGPSIGPRAYAVGPEVVSAFALAYPADDLISNGNGHPHLDLWEANAAQCRRAGLADGTLHTSGICTFAQGDHFFSHRYAERHNETEGRFAVLVSIEE
ncbi:MAG: polyphenol oxidase family protein [Thermomicrobiales bacterium]